MDWKTLVGFARKANKLTIGRKATLAALKRGKVCLIILAKDAGRAVREEMIRFSEESKIGVIWVNSKEDMGRVVGRESCSVLGLTDSRMAQGVIDFEQNKGLRVSEDDRPFYKGAYGQTEGPWCGGKNSYEHDRYRGG
ncbi:MAG: L7Ae/L30e/S12e/Gadd45 family ribosomal protein [Synergistetes bacterium]|nr:L7Ae/L30e/S12e/Gadd45 family ribosomal protein [Synergistota bacterium]MCX8128191.1 L7Ae/L30e/S12e/Gadd45 family ribosomal protein [Synergistota bacterium]MDW8192567.1 L7Ae/L30e/S12e/Gadd45 family ribosomal protein [Synergistota bacterium]